METEQLLDMVSLSGSVLATGITLFFWLVKARREKPLLRSYAVGSLDAAQAPSAKDGHVRNTFFYRGVVANYSTLPNAVIGVRVRVKMRSGEWVEAQVSAEKEQQLPLNVSPLQTAPLVLQVGLESTGSLSGSTTIDRRDNALAALSSPPQFDVELTALGRRAFRDIVTVG